MAGACHTGPTCTVLNPGQAHTLPGIHGNAAGAHGPGKSMLTYYISEGVLVGTVAGKFVHIFAASGGGGGTLSKEGPVDPEAVNNPYKTGQKTEGKTRGGPIPVGVYRIESPAPWHNGRAARLVPSGSDAKFRKATGRDGGFLIHTRGKLGSDGCIVPMVQADFVKLMDGLAADGGGHLTVLETMEDGAFA